MSPTILTQFDAETGEFAIMVKSHGRVEPAGPRILRAPPHPDIKFHGHETFQEAEKDANLLRKYISGITKDGTKRRKESA